MFQRYKRVAGDLRGEEWHAKRKWQTKQKNRKSLFYFLNIVISKPSHKYSLKSCFALFKDLEQYVWETFHEPYMQPAYSSALPLLLISFCVLVVGQDLHLFHLCKLSSPPDHLLPVTCKAKWQILYDVRQSKPLHFQNPGTGQETHSLVSWPWCI